MKETALLEGTYGIKVAAAARVCKDRLLSEELTALAAEEAVLRQKLSLEKEVRAEAASCDTFGVYNHFSAAQAHAASTDFLARKAAEMQHEARDKWGGNFCILLVFGRPSCNSQIASTHAAAGDRMEPSARE